MTTPNGHDDLDPNGTSHQATSTVLALDGWGPVMPEPGGNGTNGMQAETPTETADQTTVEQPIAPSRPPRSPLEQLSSRLEEVWSAPFPTVPVDGQLIRILASAAAMTLAVLLAVNLGKVLQTSASAIPQPTPLEGVDALRRRIALAVDPSLTPASPPTRRPLPDWIPALHPLSMWIQNLR